ncbi:MAG TPA: DUF11 domain-containing protein [Actinomycetota bacterium]|nr:DUF11 domain-containing protein [Actinomycetota bacterium]
MTTRRRILIWAAVTLLGGLATAFPLAAIAVGDSSADLSVTQVATNSGDEAIDGTTAKLYAGQVVTYTVTVSNKGPSNAESVTVTETAPVQIDPGTLQSCDPQAADCSVLANFTDYSSGTSLSLGAIAATDSKDMVFRGQVKPATPPRDITNTVSASSAQTDPDTTNSTDVALVTPVDTLGDISVSQVAKNSAGKAIDKTNKVRAGDVITYVATVKNAGPSDARNVKVKNTFDSGVTNQLSCVGSCSASSGFSSYQSSSLLSLGPIAAGATETVSFRGTLPSTITATTDITNVVSAKSYKSDTVGATADSDTADATSTFTTTVYEAKQQKSSSANSSTNNSSLGSGPSTGVYFGKIGAPTYFEPQQRTKTVVIKKVYYQSAFGRRIPEAATAPLVETATQTVFAPVASRIVRMPEEVWLVLPVGLLLIIWITYLVLEPYEDQLLAPARTPSPAV